MSRKTRLTYLILLALVFFVIIVPLIFYALGYRLDNVVGLVKTGGIFISTDKSGIDIYVDGVFQKRTNIFQRSFLAPNMKQGLHLVNSSNDLGKLHLLHICSISININVF